MQNDQTNKVNTGEKEETIAQLAHRHLLDPNHETTDEELRKVKIEFVDGDIDEEKVVAKEKELRGEKSDDDKKDNDIITPYDVIKG